MGIAWSILQEVFPPAPKFTTDDIPDMSGKVVFVTGANAGIGKETARHGYGTHRGYGGDGYGGYGYGAQDKTWKKVGAINAASMNIEGCEVEEEEANCKIVLFISCSLDPARGYLRHRGYPIIPRVARVGVYPQPVRVWIAARDKAKGEAAVKELKERTGNDAHLLLMNLANLKSIKAAAEEFLSGVMTPPVDMLTDDGYDLQFGTNVLGHFYFTKLLMPLLLATAKISPDGAARVVNTSSNAHWFGGFNFDTFKDGPARRKMSAFQLYGQSKTGNIILSAELKRRYGDQGLVSTSLNPGGIKTELLRHTTTFSQWIGNMMFKDVSFGALTQLYAGTTPDGVALNGMYLVPWARIGVSLANDSPQLGRELWTWLEEQVESV
ncbi:NAD(P)-binding protein [Leucogyrophana mollusca]|uniref:NAD(P)-binding protein n=1 Tax=Leucogyrophana mollusca TaxID=85980 RepID=A0ACB8BFG7_9AGAM|nr:NAD(P)-binding protein [Leucogyrophana mollusca]